MKKLLFLFALFFSIPFFSQAQEPQFPIQPKTWSIGGGASLRLNQTEYDAEYSRKIFGLNLRPNVGYAIGENLMLGTGLRYSYNETRTVDSSNDREQSGSGVGIFPFISKYFNLNNRFAFNLTGELGYEYGWGENYTLDNGYESTSNSFEASIRPGITYFVSQNIALNAQLGGIFYNYTSREHDGELDMIHKSFMASIQMDQFYFGINFFF